jgi:hypothetical protein
MQTVKDAVSFRPFCYSLRSAFLLTPFFQQANYVSESVQGSGATASKEANKETAKSDNASLSTRATAAKDAVGDKMDESSHNAKGEAYKEKAKN